jgi:hypothetical protein
LRPLANGRHFKADRYETRDIRIFDAVEKKLFPLTPDQFFLGYLLLITDQLQDWDRYRIIRTGDLAARQTIEGRHVWINVDRNFVSIEFRGPAWVGERCMEIKRDLTLLTAEPGSFLGVEYNAT